MTFDQINRFDTRELLANAKQQALEKHLDEFVIVDVDAHHYENESWSEIVQYIENPVIRHLALSAAGKGGGRPGLLPSQVGNQDVSGRVSRYQLRKWEEFSGSENKVVQQVTRYMDMMGIDYTVLFPTPMLNLGLHPQTEVEVAIARAYARWIHENVLSANSRIKTMLYLPFNDPEASVQMVEEFSELPGVVGFMVTSVRYKPVHDKAYMKLYALLEERGKPLGFHAGYNWIGERSIEQFNKFISVHAIGFVLYNMIHLTNFVINGIPERFPKLKVIWIESGLAWIPFMMQRLDNEYLMRTSEAPLLQKRPSEYMQEFYYTSQPMERTHLNALAVTFEMIHAETQLLYSSDYPHWDFDTPGTIYDLPFLSERARRRILGENACQLFGLPQIPLKTNTQTSQVKRG
ncbi:MAG: amidohydrolase [Alicyclobacillus sp.]|nr:amidohydrolase [Alicyclobacillus sp.]